MDSVQNNNSNYIFMQPCHFCIHHLLSFFRQDTISILCCACVQASSTQETCFVHLLIISPFSCVFPLPLITVATSCKVLRRDWVYYKAGRSKNKKCFLIFSHSRYPLVTFGCMKAVYLPSQWRASHLLEKTTTYRQSAHKQTSTTSHHLPAAGNADTVWGAASSRRQLGFHSLLQYISSPYNVAFSSISIHVSILHPTSPIDPVPIVTFVFSCVAGDAFLWHPSTG